MPDREKIIKGLEFTKAMITFNPSTGEDIEPEDLNKDNKITYDACVGAIALLKEQSAHILTIGQLEDALDTVVWLETPGQENLADGYSLIISYSHKYECMFFDSPFGNNPSQDRLEYSQYGKSWRCWDKRPSEEQRMAVKWE